MQCLGTFWTNNRLVLPTFVVGSILSGKYWINSWPFMKIFFSNYIFKFLEVISICLRNNIAQSSIVAMKHEAMISFSLWPHFRRWLRCMQILWHRNDPFLMVPENSMSRLSDFLWSPSISYSRSSYFYWEIVHRTVLDKYILVISRQWTIFSGKNSKGGVSEFCGKWYGKETNTFVVNISQSINLDY